MTQVATNLGFDSIARAFFFAPFSEVLLPNPNAHVNKVRHLSTKVLLL
jgi:hypothetical protein